MNIEKISKFIKQKRRDIGITQEELANELFVTEKAVSRWETGRGTPDISLLIPLSKALNVDVAEILNGEDNESNIENLIKYDELNKYSKNNVYFKLVISLYILSIIVFLIYLRLEYNQGIEVNYFIRLGMVILSGLLIVIANKIYNDKYVEKIEDKNKVNKFSKIIIFVYYIILLFNMVFFARFNHVNGYNLIPFKSIIGILNSSSIYSIVINIFGNLLVFMPLEYFIIELFNVKKFSMNFLLSLIIIIVIEISQYIFKVGIFDVDDIILCTTGMMLFYGCYVKFKSFKSK